MAKVEGRGKGRNRGMVSRQGTECFLCLRAPVGRMKANFAHRAHQVSNSTLVFVLVCQLCTLVEDSGGNNPSLRGCRRDLKICMIRSGLAKPMKPLTLAALDEFMELRGDSKWV